MFAAQAVVTGVSLHAQSNRYRPPSSPAQSPTPPWTTVPPSSSVGSFAAPPPNAQDDTPGNAGTFSINSRSPTKGRSVGSPLSYGPPATDPFEFSKRDPEFSKTLQSKLSKSAASVVKFGNQAGGQILGTVVSTNGMVVTKYSVVKTMQFFVLPDQTRGTFRIIGFDEKKDLCLVRVNQRGLTPIQFRNDLDDLNDLNPVGPRGNFENRSPTPLSVTLKPPTIGTLAMSVGHQNQLAAFGMVTLGHHDFGIQQPQCPDCIDMGVTISPYPSLTRINGVVYPLRKGLKVLRVYPRSVGEQAGLLVGDLINTVNGVRASERQVFDREVKKIRSGDFVTLKVFRLGNAKSLTFKIPSAKKTPFDRWGGGPYSERRFGLGPVIVHDSVIAPEDCGGPLVDVDGNVIGINIARAMRVASFAINIEDVYLFVKRRSPETKLQFNE